ncbi:MAG: LysE family transporter [Bacteroidales bacterium]|nr:LysE family transporter [Bacteroidales bacterium]
MTLFNFFISSYIVAFSGAIMPGPLLSYTISKTTTMGFKATPLLILGHAILEIIFIALILLGFKSYLQNNIFITTVSFSGALVLAYMSIQMFLSIPKLTLNLSANQQKSKNTILAGALVSISNPYWIIWWVTIGLGYILISQQYGFVGICIFFIGHILGDLTWYSFISYLVTGGKKYFTDKVYKYLIGVCAALLIIFSGIFIYYGFSRVIQ